MPDPLEDRSPLREAPGRCQWCGSPLKGRQQRWCGESCKVEAFWASRAGYLLSCLPQKEFRRVIRRACEARWPLKRGRLRVRFGHPWDDPGRPGPHS